MSETEKTLTAMLNEETWTRSAISNYSISNFQELDTIIIQAKKDGELLHIKEICTEQLSRSKNSIISLYILSIISLMHQDLDDSNLITLIEIFTENMRPQIVEHLCLQFLKFGEAKFALRTLADLYKQSDNEQRYEILERLSKIDYDDAEAPKKIAERAEAQGDTEKAVEYYKKAIYRYMSGRKSNNIKEVWTKLVALIPEEIEFFYRAQAKIGTVLGESKNTFFMHDLCKYYKEAGNWNVAIDILKLMLHYDSEDPKARTELIECYRQKYADHSQLEEYIKVSNLSQNWRPVFEAVSEFEKHIAFDVGNFVFHKTWGVGRIRSLENEVLTIDFAKKRKHEMSLPMALTSLQTLDSEHIWVLKSTKQKAELLEKVKSDPAWALKVIIKSFDNDCNMKKVKQELVPSLLSVGEWTGWNTKARKILKEDPSFGINPHDVDSYTVRERPASTEEKLFNEFKAQKNFFSRIEIFDTYIEKADVDDDYFHEMFNYFDGFLKAPSQINEQVVASQMIVNAIVAKMPHLVGSKQVSFAELYENIEDPAAIYTAIKDKNLKQVFLKNVKNLISNWENEYIKLFPSVLSQDIVNAIIEEGHVEKLQEFAQTCFDNPRVFRDTIIWFFKNSLDDSWFKAANIDYEKQLIALINILDVSLREIENKQNTTENRRTVKQVSDLLFTKQKLLEDFIETADKETVGRLYILIADIKGLDSALKAQLRAQIQKKFPDFVFFDAEEKETTTLGLIVTAHMMSEKKKELQNIIEVLIPQNQRDIGFAKELGDLSENAEYKSAREEQNKLSSLSTRLQSEIERAEVFDPLTINSKKVSFGTKVSLENTTDNRHEEYTILGPWESDPDNGIISYLSPLGHALMNKKKNESVEVKIMDQAKTYRVLEISPAKID